MAGPPTESEVQLDFENQVFVELLSEDGLVILARQVALAFHTSQHIIVALYTQSYSTCRGLGLDKLFLKFLKLYSDPHNLILALNTSSAQEVSSDMAMDCMCKL